MAAGQGGALLAITVILMGTRMLPPDMPDLHDLITPGDFLLADDAWTDNEHHSAKLAMSALLPQNQEASSGKQRWRTLTTTRCTSPMRYLSTLCLLMANDVHVNPGPIKYPCGVCAKPVKRNETGILCDVCEFWHHAKCEGIDKTEYNRLSTTVGDWFCNRCTLPPFSDSFFDTTLPLDTSTISAHSAEKSAELTDDETECDIFIDIRKIKAENPKRIITAYLNINSLRYKFCELQGLLSDRLVDILCIAETKLDDNFSSQLFSVDGYRLFRKDRNASGGGLVMY
jgi:hypothetical protein